MLPLQSRQQASQIDSHYSAADEPHNASTMLPSGGAGVQGTEATAWQAPPAEWLLFTDAAHLVLDQQRSSLCMPARGGF